MNGGMKLYQRKPGGTYYVRLPGGRRISLGTRDKDTAHELLAAMESKSARSRLHLLDSSRITLAQFHKEYIDHLGGLQDSPGLVSFKTRKRYDLSLRMLEAGVGANCLLRNLTTRKLSQWAGMRRQGLLRGPGKGSGPMRPISVNTDLRAIRTALEAAVDWGYLERPPKIKMLRIPKSPPRCLMPAEVDAVLAARPANWNDTQYQERTNFWRFCLHTCLRRAEALNLCWEHVVLGKVPILRVVGKGDKPDKVALLPAAVATMGPPQESGPVFTFSHASHRPPQAEIQAAQKLYSNIELGQRYGVTEGAIRRWAGKPELLKFQPHLDTLTHWFKDQVRAAGLELPRLHDIRHTGISYLLALGISPRMVQRIARHSDFSMTEQYAAGDVDLVYAELMDKISGLDFNTDSAHPIKKLYKVK